MSGTYARSMARRRRACVRGSINGASAGGGRGGSAAAAAMIRAFTRTQPLSKRQLR